MWTQGGALQKTGVCGTLLLATEQDISHDRSTDFFLWTHDIILKHTYLLVSNPTLTNQPHHHTGPLTAKLQAGGN